MPRAEKDRLRIFPGQSGQRRPIADDDLGARQIEIEKGFEILFHRDAPDAKEYRTREPQVLSLLHI